MHSFLFFFSQLCFGFRIFNGVQKERGSEREAETFSMLFFVHASILGLKLHLLLLLLVFWIPGIN